MFTVMGKETAESEELQPSGNMWTGDRYLVCVALCGTGGRLKDSILTDEGAKRALKSANWEENQCFRLQEP